MEKGVPDRGHGGRVTKLPSENVTKRRESAGKE